MKRTANNLPCWVQRFQNQSISASQRRPIALKSAFFTIIWPLNLTAYNAFLWFLRSKRTLNESPLKARRHLAGLRVVIERCHEDAVQCSVHDTKHCNEDNRSNEGSHREHGVTDECHSDRRDNNQ